jgi:CarD family transcriptional regulator
VNSDKVFTRHIISKEEVEKIIASIPEIKVDAKSFDNTGELSEHYKSIISNHNCKDLIELLMVIYKKREIASEQKRKLWQVDEVYQKQAENQLYSEFAVALNIDINEVEAYIQEKIK